jgi:hypothetical protein
MARTAAVVSHWHQSIVGLSTSSLEFYNAIEVALNAKEVKVRIERLNWNEGGVFSGQRTYLRVGHAQFVFDISAFPFGKDFYFSWWLGRRVPGAAGLIGCLGLVALPLIWATFFAMAGLVWGTLLFVTVLGAAFLAMGQRLQAGASETGDMVMAMPFFGAVFEKFFRPTTYYSEDTRIMFEETVHRVVIDVISGILTANAMLPLTPEQKALTAPTVPATT